MSQLEEVPVVTFPGVEYPEVELDTEESPFRLMAEQRLGISHAKLLARINDRFEIAQKARRAQELTWYYCLAFYHGDQYAHINRDLMRVESGRDSKNTPKHRVRETNNVIKAATDNLVAQLVRGMPTLAARPATEDASDVDGALMASAILESEWRRLRAMVIDHDMRSWKTITGTAGIWTRWNETLGPETLDPQTQQAHARGENELLACSPFKLYPDPNATTMGACRFFIHASEEDVEGLREAYPELKSKIVAEETTRQREHGYEKDLQRGVSGSLGGIAGSTLDDKTTTGVMHYWEPPSKKFPQGIMAIATSTVVLWMDTNRWSHWGGSEGWCPIELFYHSRITDSIWGQGAVECAIELQKALNRCLSQITEHRNLVLRPIRWIPDYCVYDEKKMTGEPNLQFKVKMPPMEVLANKGPWRPETEVPPPFPQGHLRMAQFYMAAIEDVFSYHEVLKGQAPGQVRGVQAIESLAERDEVNQFPVAMRDNESWAQIGKRLLQLVHDAWDEQRMVKVRGEDGEAEVYAVKGMDIPSEVDVIVETDTLLPSSKSGRARMLMEYVNAQIITPEQAREAVFGGYGYIKAAVSRATRDQRKQRREIQKLIRGVFVEPDNFDAHEQHLEEINVFRKTPAFERMRYTPIMAMRMVPDPATGQMAPTPLGMTTIGEIVEAHAASHVELLKVSLMAQTQSQPMPTGAPGEAGATGQGEGAPPSDSGPPTAEPERTEQQGVAK